MKKTLVILLTLAIVFSLLACAPAPVTSTPADEPSESPAEQESQAPAENQEPSDEAGPLAGKKLAFINAGPDDYYAAFGNAFVAVAKAYGATDITEVNSEYKADKELANVQDMISAGVDAIAVISANAAGSAVAIAEANAANVPIFYCGGRPELKEGSTIQGHVTDSFIQMGYLAGQWVAENYPDAKCVTIPGQLGQRMAEGEVVGFKMALQEAGMEELKVLASGGWQKELTIPIMEALVDSGEEFDVVFAANDETAFGVIQVLKERGITIKQYPDDGKEGVVVVSNNGKDTGWEAMTAGELAISVPNPPSLTADLCVQQMVAYFGGEEYEPYIQISPSIILDATNTDKGISWDLDTYMQQRADNVFVWALADYEKAYLQIKDKLEEFDKLVDEYMAAQ